MRQQKGFTLIELIVVIVILGILAASAVPKFSNLSADARVAKMNALAATLKGAAAMAHGQSLAGALGGASTVTLEDGTIVDMLNHYPNASTSGIMAALDGVANGYASAVSAITGGGNAWAFYPDVGRTNCAIYYIPATTTMGISAVPIVDDTKVTGATYLGGPPNAASGVLNCQ